MDIFKNIVDGVQSISTNRAYTVDIDSDWSMSVAEEGEVIGPSHISVGEIRQANLSLFCDYRLSNGRDPVERANALERVKRDLIISLYGQFLGQIDRAIAELHSRDSRAAIKRLTELHSKILGEFL
jgi:hypothetical protein